MKSKEGFWWIKVFGKAFGIAFICLKMPWGVIFEISDLFSGFMFNFPLINSWATSLIVESSGKLIISYIKSPIF